MIDEIEDVVPLTEELANPVLTWGSAWLPAGLASGPDLFKDDDNQA